MATKRVIFVVDDERDRDVLSWWEQQDNKSAAIRDLIRTELRQGSVTLQDIYRAVTELEQRIGSGQVLFTSGSEPDLVSDEPDDVVDALENLGL
jgi:hypothetical protein